ncbi:hypothetical protein D3C79_972080 [compost metagenome]
MLALQQLYPPQRTQLHNCALHRLAVMKILADIIAEIRSQPFNIELGLLNRIVADHQLFEAGLALDQDDFVL